MKKIAISCHTTPVNVVKLNEDGDLLFSASNDKYVKLFYSVTGERIGTFRCEAAVKSIDISRDSKLLISVTSIGHVELWEVNGGKRVGMLCDNMS